MDFLKFSFASAENMLETNKLLSSFCNN